MKLHALLLALTAICVGPAIAQTTLPNDVTRFVERRDRCDHFRGEEPYDAQRRAFLARQLRRSCSGTDRRLAALKSKYRDSPSTRSVLDAYEPSIEGPGR